MTQLPTDEVYQRIVDALGYRFDGVFSIESIALAVDQTRADLEPTARIADYLPVLTERFALERLTATAQSEGRITKEVPELLFICVHNAGRSQLAAALAEHLAAGRVHVRTAGSAPADHINPDVVTVLAERGIDISEAYPKPLSDSVVLAADAVITMGCGDVCPIHPGKRYEDWDVQDPAGQPLDVVREIRDDIQTRVATLLRELGI